MPDTVVAVHFDSGFVKIRVADLPSSVGLEWDALPGRVAHLHTLLLDTTV